MFFKFANTALGRMQRQSWLRPAPAVQAAFNLTTEVTCLVRRWMTLAFRGLPVHCAAHANLAFCCLSYQGPHTGHRRGEHVCIDRNAFGIGHHGDQNGHLLYPVETTGIPGYGTHYEVCFALVLVSPQSHVTVKSKTDSLTNLGVSGFSRSSAHSPVLLAILCSLQFSLQQLQRSRLYGMGRFIVPIRSDPLSWPRFR